MRIYLIYTLINPITGKPFYVGATSQTLNTRLCQHILESESGSSLKVCEYIRAMGRRPKIRVLEQTDLIDSPLAREIELSWIEFLEVCGFELANLNAPIRIKRGRKRLHEDRPAVANL